MGWEHRARGGPYYIRRRKVEGREIRQYYGKGPAAEKAAAEDAARREQREAARAERKMLDMLESRMAAYCGATEVVVHAALLAAGYHRPNRGVWRKRRGSGDA